MSSNMTIVGNLTRDGELRFGKESGKPWATFRLAVNYTPKDGDKKTSYFDVACWNELAENMAELPKGTRVWFTGRQEMREWETDAGEKRQSYSLKADDGGLSLRWDGVGVSREGKRSASSSAGDKKAVEAVQQGFDGATVEEEPF